MTTPQLSMAEMMTTEEVNRDNARILDAIVQSGVQRKDLTVPPAHVNGNCWIVAAGATDEWATKDGKVAQSYNGLWYFLTPKEGWTFWVNNENKYYVYDGSAWISNASVVGGAYKNKIIGGNFDTNPWQRGTSFSNYGSGQSGNYVADRWLFGCAGSSVLTVGQVADAPTVGECGYLVTNCLCLDVTTASPTVGSNDFVALSTRIEGYNYAPLSQRTMTLSFWHKHTVTGTYCVSFRNASSNRSYVAEYTQAVTNAWEKATIILTGDTGGSWNVTTGIGLNLSFWAMAGSGSFTNANMWLSNALTVTANQVNGVNDVNNFFKIALVQLEAGSAATDFEFRDVGTELVLCQRYYNRLSGNYTLIGTGGTTPNGASSYAEIIYFYPVKMRTAPTLSTSGTGFEMLKSGSASWAAANSYNTWFVQDTCHIGTINWTSDPSCISWGFTALRINDSSTYVAYSAEL